MLQEQPKKWQKDQKKKKKKVTKALIHKTEQTQRFQNQIYSYQRGNVRGRDKLGSWD